MAQTVLCSGLWGVVQVSGANESVIGVWGGVIIPYQTTPYPTLPYHTQSYHTTPYHGGCGVITGPGTSLP